MNKSLSFKITAFCLNVLNMFFLLVILLPFAAQAVQDIHPMLYVNLYRYHFQFFTIFSSIILAVPLSYLIFRMHFTNKQKVVLFLIQLLALLSLILLYYLNMNYLGELMVRPSYE